MKLPPHATTITISEETAGKLAETVVENNLDSVADTVDYAANVARDPETLSDAELARLLCRTPAD